MVFKGDILGPLSGGWRWVISAWWGAAWASVTSFSKP